MFYRKLFLVSVAASVFLFLIFACSVDRFPKNAKLCGEYWVSCVAVQEGMYHCRVFSKLAKKLVAEKTYISPVYYGSVSERDLSSRVTQYDGDTISFDDGKRKLIVCDIPEDAVRVQSIQGGAWISYHLVDKKEKLYFCTAYNVKDASVLSSGTYVLKAPSWDAKARKMKFLDVKKSLYYFAFVYYGGVGISLKDNMVLMPFGWIEYPDGPRSGLRVQYDANGNVIKEEEYG